MNELQRLLVSATLVDARGLACPAPIIELAKTLRRAALVELWADDPAAWADLEAFLSATGHERVAADRASGVVRAVIRRGAGR
ncbi:MAG: sulfurtransferase TusA family protein [Myxococcota bacterium]